MNEKSFAGGSRKAAAEAAKPAGTAGRSAPGAAGLAAVLDAGLAAGAAPAGGVAARGGPKLLPRPGLPPKRPPDKLSQPSTGPLKKSGRTIRFEVGPPCECQR